MRAALGLSVAATVAGAVMASSGSAQETELGSRIAKRAVIADQYSAARAQAGAHSLADCLVHRRTRTAAMMLDALESRALQTYNAALGRDIDCIGAAGDTDLQTGFQLSAGPALWRGLIAEHLIREKYPRTELAAEPLQHAYSSAWTGLDGRPAVMDDMAVCVAATNPSGVRGVLATVSGSAEEASALASLGGSLGQCLQSNAKLSGNRQSIRAALAEALYHRLAAPAPQPAGN